MIGNLANDPETRTTQSGVTTCSFRLAVQRKFANADGKRDADFLPIICWRQTAENCARYLSKGRKVAVEGWIQTRSYDAQDGSKRYVTEIIADSVEFLTAENGDKAAPVQPSAQEPPAGYGQGFTEVTDDNLPF